jgi:SAM-dependent methyltransferase
MRLWQRFKVSVDKRGWLKTAILVPGKLRASISLLGDRVFDIRNGTDTFEVVELNRLDIPSVNKARGIRYEPTRARSFFKVMNNLALPADGCFVDFGCGKGRVLIMASECGFKRITGVDFSRELCERAKENVSTYRSRRNNGAEIKVVNIDAVDYEVQKDDTVFYFFNPFDEMVLGRVLDNITDSLSTSPRHIWLIYHNPLWRRVIERWTMFNAVASFKLAGGEFVVYTNKE